MNKYGINNNRRTDVPNNSNVLPKINTDKAGLIPCVRYGSSSDSKPTQYPTLRPVNEPISEGATTASPIYYLTEDQLNNQDDLDSPYAVRGDYPIAKSLQDECENANRVRYPVVVESDSDVDLDEMAQEVVRFVKDYLGTDPRQYTVWYSGGRSIHVHVAAFVDKSDWDQIRQIAEAFNESATSDVELDPAIYSRKRQFRLPGVKHRDGEGLKVQVDPEGSHEEIFRKAHTQDRDVPKTFLDVLNETVPSQISRSPSADQLDLQNQGPDIEADERSTEETSSSPLIHQRDHPSPNPDRWTRFWRHNGHTMSPYANAEADDLHSVTVVKVMGEPFERDGEHFVPCNVYGAIGGDGNYRVFSDDKRSIPRPVKLSGHDIKKWDYERSDYVVILGGKSRRSRIFQVLLSEAVLTAQLLEDKGRKDALRHLNEWGYDIGSTGMNGVSRTTSSEGSVEPSKAARLQRQIEQEGVDSVDNGYEAMFRVACRLLKLRGWNKTWKWVQQVYGDEFDPEETYNQLTAIVDSYPEDYNHVTVPSRQ